MKRMLLAFNVVLLGSSMFIQADDDQRRERRAGEDRRDRDHDDRETRRRMVYVPQGASRKQRQEMHDRWDVRTKNGRTEMRYSGYYGKTDWTDVSRARNNSVRPHCSDRKDAHNHQSYACRVMFDKK